MTKRKTWLLGTIVLCVDGATAANVYETFRYFEHPFFSALVALSFAALQIGTLVLFAQPLPEATRRWLFVGAAILLTVTGLSNVSMGYIRSLPVFPAKVLLPALGFGGDAVSLGVAAAWMSGLALVGTGLLFWTNLGQHIRQGHEREQEALKDLDDLFKR